MKIIVILIFCALFFGNISSAGEVEKVVFCSINKENSRLYKISDAILRNAFESFGITFELRVFPPKRIPLAIENGKIDGDTHRIYNFNRENHFPNLIRVEEPIQIVAQSVFTKLEDIDVNGWKSLSSFRVIYLSGIKTTENGMDFAGIPIEKRIGVYDIDKAFELLNLGRGDIVVVSPSTGRASRENLGIATDGIRMVTPPVVNIKLYPYLHKKNADLATKLAIKLKEMKEIGLYDEIINAIEE